MSVDRLGTLRGLSEMPLATLYDGFADLLKRCNGIKLSNGIELLDEALNDAYADAAVLAGFVIGTDSCVGEHRRKLWVKVFLAGKGHAWVRLSCLPGQEEKFVIDRVQFKGVDDMGELLRPYMEDVVYRTRMRQIDAIRTHCGGLTDEELVPEDIAAYAKLPGDVVEAKFGKQSKAPVPGKNRTKIWFRVTLNAGNGDGPTHALIRISRIYGEGGPFSEIDRVLLQWK